MSEVTARPFQVDLRGVVDLLSRHIYASPHVYLRELLQNGRDAIVARRQVDPSAPTGEIRIEALPGGLLVFRDNGIGLSLSEASDVLATVGRSSKRDDVLDLRRDDYLGQFGIGLLACFMVGDTIQVTSRSARGDAPIEWTGSADGTFTIREVADGTGRQEVGTTVTLRARPDDAELVAPERVATLASHYGRYLAETILVASGRSWDRVNEPAIFLDAFQEPDEDLLGLGHDLLGVDPLDVIPLSVPGTGTRGVAFVLPFAPPPGGRQSHRVYLGRMLLNESLPDLLPDWAFFVRCVINTDGLAPTASRERLIESDALDFTRDELGRALRRWILQTALTRPHRLQEFLAVHHLALKALALEDDELAAVVLPHLSIETSLGLMTIGDYVARFPQVRYTTTVDEFRQIAAVVSPQAPVINGGYTYETQVLRRLPDVFPQVGAVRVRVTQVLDDLDVPDLRQRDAALSLERRAGEVLAAVGCGVDTRVFQPPNVPSLYVVDPAVLRRLARRDARDVAPALWADVLAEVDEHLQEQAGSDDSTGRLCLNWASPLIQALSGLGDALVFDRAVSLLYVQSKLAGHHPLSAADRSVLNRALNDLIHLSVGVTDRLTDEGAS